MSEIEEVKIGLLNLEAKYNNMYSYAQRLEKENIKLKKQIENIKYLDRGEVEEILDSHLDSICILHTQGKAGRIIEHKINLITQICSLIPKDLEKIIKNVRTKSN